MKYYSDTSNLMVTIVKRELRAIGEYKTYSATPDIKSPMGNYWWNTNHETDEAAGELYEQLLAIQVNDPEFYEIILGKIGRKGFNLVYRNNIAYETEKRARIARHTPQDQKYAIYHTNDYGQQQGDYISSVVLKTTGDPEADRHTAVRMYLAEKEGKSLNEEILGVGYYGACPLSQGELNLMIEKLETRLDTLRSL